MFGLNSAALRWLVLGASASLVLAGTLVPSGTQTFGWARCVFCSPRAFSDALVNLALFVPFAVALRRLGAGVASTIGAGALFSGAIEVAQLRVPGRDPSFSDLLTNTLGAAIGAFLAPHLPRLVRPGAVLAERLAAGAAVVAWAVWIATGLAIEPSLPATAYWGQWTPRLESLEPYLGTVVTATVGGERVPPEKVVDSESLRRRLAGSEPVHVGIVAGPATSRVSSIFSIADDEARRVLLVGAVKDDLVFRYRARSADWRMNQPDIRSEDALAPVREGDRVELSVTKGDVGYCARVDARERCGLGYSIGDGWSLILSSSMASVTMRQVLQGVWVAALAAPVGFWARRGGLSVAAVALLAAALWVAPILTGLLPTPPHEWAGAAIGLGCGGAVRLLCR